ncbi:MAG: hypothetical protein A4E68_02260 [Syntrophaceae bacterium PtaB.Bin095]|nr:MAG: hypothetical protein A4E68_02260 [Syntrophaceae bacterium PtaB.Bin095]
MQENSKTTDAEKPVFWRPLQPGEVIHELVDVAEDPAVQRFPVEAAGVGHPAESVAEEVTAASLTAGIPADEHKETMDETSRIIAATVERVTREMIPAIAERVIREEIEKLKGEIA